MRHYEIVFLVHPDRSDQVNSMLDRYRSLVEKNGGKVHRLENWGRKDLAYTINKVRKAHYILMNIECNEAVLAELKHIFRFSDGILRNLITLMPKAITTPSPLAKEAKHKKGAAEKKPVVVEEAVEELDLTNDDNLDITNEVEE